MGVGLGRIRTVVLAVAKTLGIEAHDLAAIGDDPQPLAFDQRRAADALVGIVQGPTGGKLFAGKLPVELAVALAEAEQTAQVHLRRVAFEPARPVIGGTEDFAVGDDR